MQAMSWAPNGSKSIQNQPPANTPSGNQHLVKLQLLSSGSFWALWDVESQYFVPVPGKKKGNQPRPITADKACTHQRINHFIKPSDEQQSQMLGWQGQGWDSLNGSSTVQQPFSAVILLQQRNRHTSEKHITLKPVLVCKAKFTVKNLLLYCLLSSIPLLKNPHENQPHFQVIVTEALQGIMFRNFSAKDQY